MNARVFFLVVALCVAFFGVSSLGETAGYEMSASDAFWIFESNQTDGRASESIAAAGDVNGDGYDDLIVGARFYDNGAENAGVAWVFYGGEDGYGATPDVTLNPPSVQQHGFFGYQVAGAGDVNDDGYDDVMVGMMNWDQPNPFFHDEGAVFVYYGGDGALDPTYDWWCHAGVQWAHLGWGMDTAGDVNGDGYDDIIVGGFDYTNFAFEAAMVFHGSNTGLDANGTRPIGMPANADWVVTTDQADAYFGTRVGTTGDVNGDGYDDVAIGAYKYDNGQTDEGVLFLWYGSAGGLGPNTTAATADWRAESDQIEAFLTGPGEPSDMGAAGDVNGDGYDDLIVGTWAYDSVYNSDGIVLLFYGAADGLGSNGNPANADWVATGLYEADCVGGHVARAGDFNGDGLDDIVIGAQNWDGQGGSTNSGLATIWYGNTTGLPRWGTPYYANVMIEGEQDSAVFTRTLTAAGDVNDDGFDDLAIGSFYYDGGQTDEGAVFAFYGQQATFIDDFETGDTLRWPREVD